MYRIRRRALALLIALSCFMPVCFKASASQDQMLDFIKIVAPDSLPSPPADDTGVVVAADEAVEVPYQGKDFVKALSSRWGKDVATMRQIVDLAHEFSDPVFPQPQHILAIAAVESSFNPHAKSRGNVGVMQINLLANGKKLKNRTVRENMRVGAELLRQYFGLLKNSQKAAVLSYNAGIGSYLKGRYNSAYWRKYQKELGVLDRLYGEGQEKPCCN